MRLIRAWSACVPALLVCNGCAFAQDKGLEFVRQPGWIESDHDADGVRDYAWIGYPRYFIGTLSMKADDVHRTTNDPITALNVGMRCNDGLGSYSVHVRILTNDSQNELYPSEDSLLWDGFFSGLPGDAQGMMLLELPRPIQAPRDIWVAFQFDRTTTDGPGLLVPELPITDQIGWSDNWMLTDDGDGDLLPNGGIWSEDTNLSFMMEVYSQPGSLPAPGAVAALAFMGVASARRRR